MARPAVGAAGRLLCNGVATPTKLGQHGYDSVGQRRITQGAPAVEAVALHCQAVLEALRGRTEAARRMIASSRTMVGS